MSVQIFIQVVIIATIIGLNIATWMTVKTFRESVRNFVKLTEKTLEKVGKIEAIAENHGRMDDLQHANIMAKMDTVCYKMDDLAKDMALLKGRVK